MVREGLQQLTIKKAVNALRNARASVSSESGREHPYRSLEVTRRFVKDQAQDSSGFLVDLKILHAMTGVVPRSLAFITDPTTAADLLRHEDFTSLSSDHPTYQAFKPYVGRFIVFEYEKGPWLEDRRAAARPFSHQNMERKQSEGISREAVASTMSLVQNGSLPDNWVKYLTSYQVVKHTTGHEVEPEILSEAVNAHTAYTGSIVKELVVGAIPRSVGRIITHPTLHPYHRLKHEIVQGEPKGLAKQVLANLPEGSHDLADVTASLIGGLSTLQSFMKNILYVLAKNPYLQDEILQDPSRIKNIVEETARIYPAAPYILRKTTKDVQVGETTIPKDSLVVFGIFAYGSNPEISEPSTFDPTRRGLDDMYATQGGAANVYSYGPRACLGKHLADEILYTTTELMVRNYRIGLSNDPIIIIGKGIGSNFDRPVDFTLTERSTGKQISATSKR